MPPALGARSLSLWTTREIPPPCFKNGKAYSRHSGLLCDHRFLHLAQTHGFSYRHKAKDLCIVWQRSPTFYGLGFGFVVDKFSTGGVGGDGDGSGGNGSNGKWQMKLHSLASCSLVLC